MPAYAYALKPKRKAGYPKRKVAVRSRAYGTYAMSRSNPTAYPVMSRSAPARRLVGRPQGPQAAFDSSLGRYFALGGNMSNSYRQPRTGKWQSQAMTELEISNRVFSKSFTTAQEALEYFDPAINQTPTANPNSLGNYLCINSLARFSATTSTTTSTIRIICLQFTPSNMVGWQFSSVKPSILDTGFTPLFASNLSDIPEDINALRMSLSIKNTTINQNVGGLTRWLSLPQSLSYDFPVSTTSNMFTSAFVNQLFTMYDSHPNVMTINGSKAADDGLKMVSVPSSMIGYNQYFNYTPLVSTDVLPIRDALNTGSDAHSMNTLLLFLPETSTAQSIEATIRACFKTRYPANSTLSSLQRDHAKARQNAWEDVITKAIAVGQTKVSTENPNAADIRAGGMR